MAGLVSALGMNANTLKVNENAISVVSNNVANMNTVGYHKQTVNLATKTNEVPIGNNVYRQINSLAGVQIASVTRSTDKYLDNAYRDAISGLAGLQQQANNVGDIANLFEELEGVFKMDTVKKEDVVAVIGRYLPNFEHMETGKSLDSKM